MLSFAVVVVVLHTSGYSIRCYRRGSSPFLVVIIRARVGDDVLEFSGRLPQLLLSPFVGASCDAFIQRVDVSTPCSVVCRIGSSIRVGIISPLILFVSSGVYSWRPRGHHLSVYLSHLRPPVQCCGNVQY